MNSLFLSSMEFLSIENGQGLAADSLKTKKEVIILFYYYTSSISIGKSKRTAKQTISI